MNFSPICSRCLVIRERSPVDVLHADDVGVLREPRHRLHRHVHHAARRDVVDDDRQVHRIGDRHEVAIQPLLRRLVVIGGDHQRGIRAGALAWRVRSTASAVLFEPVPAITGTRPAAAATQRSTTS
jgi:hypothetical protein